MASIKGVAVRHAPGNTKTSPTHQDLAKRAPSDVYCVFGFKYFQEIEHFGLKGGRIGNEWMLSMIERLAEYSKLPIDDLLSDRQISDSTATRLHAINWKQKNIPIQLSDLDWMPSEVRESPDFELVQLSVSKSRGRIVGFFDGKIFQVVLLDPLHNIQPSKAYGYYVDHCEPLGSSWIAIQKHVDIAIRKSGGCECGAAKHLRENVLDPPKLGSSFVFCCHEDDVNRDIIDLLDSGTVETVGDVFRAGVDSLIPLYAGKGPETLG